MPIEVRASVRGFHGILREAGEVFQIESEDQLGSWMERTDGVTNPNAERRKRGRPRKNETAPKPLHEPAIN